MTDKPLQIPIDKIKADFQQFLIPDHNRRIIFSGPFGIGKTYFLDKFFKEKKEEYFPIFLRPINYSLLSNEDVFKFIKYDILAQIIQDESFVIEDEFDFTNTEYMKYFMTENRFLILKNFLKAFPKIRNVVSAAEDFEKLVGKYKEGLEQINGNANLKMLKTFQEDSESNFLLENDEVSTYIANKLDEIIEKKKEGENSPKKVLVIDDLDRLDPEHIFRLFNVFSAHFDQVHYYENSVEGEIRNDNKFGFDKIIFVCDIENVRKIFAYKYGSEVDFSGYIDKFYSTEIYRLHHKNTFERSIKPYFEQKFYFQDNRNNAQDVSSLFVIILELLYCGQSFNLREIKRLVDYKPSFISANDVIDYVPVFLTKMGAKQNSVIKSYKLLIVLKIFDEVLGNKEEVSRRMKKAYLHYSVNYQSSIYHQYSQALSYILLFAAADEHKFSIETEEDGTFIQKVYTTLEGKEINYVLRGGYYAEFDGEGEMWFSANPQNRNEIQLTNGEFYKILTNAIENVFDTGIME